MLAFSSEKAPEELFGGVLDGGNSTRIEGAAKSRLDRHKHRGPGAVDGLLASMAVGLGTWAIAWAVRRRQGRKRALRSTRGSRSSGQGASGEPAINEGACTMASCRRQSRWIGWKMLALALALAWITARPAQAGFLAGDPNAMVGWDGSVSLSAYL